MHAYHGHDSPPTAPLILGHEAAGRIVEAPRGRTRHGQSARHLRRAATTASAAARISVRLTQIISMPPRPGAFAEYVCATARNLVRDLPEGLTVERPRSQNRWRSPITRSTRASRVPVRPITGLTAVGARWRRDRSSGRLRPSPGRRGGLVAELNPERRATVERAGPIRAYAPDFRTRASDSVDLVIDAVGARATRAEASRSSGRAAPSCMSGCCRVAEGFDVRKITLQEVVVSGSYCYTMQDFREVVDALASGRLGALDWTELRGSGATDRAPSLTSTLTPSRPPRSS